MNFLKCPELISIFFYFFCLFLYLYNIQHLLLFVVCHYSYFSVSSWYIQNTCYTTKNAILFPFLCYVSKVHVSLLRIYSTTTGNLATRQLLRAYPLCSETLRNRVSSIQASYKYSNFERRVNQWRHRFGLRGFHFAVTSQIVKGFERDSAFVVSVYSRHFQFDLSTYISRRDQNLFSEHSSSEESIQLRRTCHFVDGAETDTMRKRVYVKSV